MSLPLAGVVGKPRTRRYPSGPNGARVLDLPPPASWRGGGVPWLEVTAGCGIRRDRLALAAGQHVVPAAHEPGAVGVEQGAAGADRAGRAGAGQGRIATKPRRAASLEQRVLVFHAGYSAVTVTDAAAASADGATNWPGGDRTGRLTPGRRSIPASVSWVPSTAGLMIAGHIILDIVGNN